MRQLLLFLCIAFGCLSGNAQKKIIDSIGEYTRRQNLQLEKALHLPSLMKTPETFRMRFSYPGKILDVWTDSVSKNHAQLKLYTFHEFKTQKDTLSATIVFSEQKADSLYSFIQNSGIVSLPTDRRIPGWTHGQDGTTYDMELAGRDYYSYKSYWTPDSQRGLKEALTVIEFKKGLSVIINTEREAIDQFNDSLPKEGCYSNGSGIGMCYVKPLPNRLTYTGKSKMPVGLGYGYGLDKIRKVTIKMGFWFDYLTDTNASSDFSLVLYKAGIFEIYDNIQLGYRSRKLRFRNDIPDSRSYFFLYNCFQLKPINISIGFDNLINSISSKTAVIFGLSKSLSFSNISLFGNMHYFNAYAVNYDIGLSKFINLKSKTIPNFTLETSYETFFEYKDVMLSIYFSF